MAFLNKAESLRLAEQLGIPDADQLPWTELQAAISAKQKELDDALPEQPKIDIEVAKEPGQTKEDENTARLRAHIRKQMRPMPDIVDDPMGEYYGKQIMMAPELKSERYRLIKYDEELGDDIELEERQFDMDEGGRVFDKSGGEIDYNNKVDAYHDYTTGTYRLKGRGERKVVAMSSVPKENYGLGITAGKDLFPIVTWNNRAGYLWTHPIYDNVKSALQDCGYYHEYKERFKHEPNIWYVAGKTLACDIGLVNAIFAEIEEKEKRKREEDAAYRRSLGL